MDFPVPTVWLIITFCRRSWLLPHAMALQAGQFDFRLRTGISSCLLVSVSTHKIAIKQLIEKN